MSKQDESITGRDLESIGLDVGQKRAKDDHVQWLFYVDERA